MPQQSSIRLSNETFYGSLHTACGLKEEEYYSDDGRKSSQVVRSCCFLFVNVCFHWVRLQFKVYLRNLPREQWKEFLVVKTCTEGQELTSLYSGDCFIEEITPNDFPAFTLMRHFFRRYVFTCSAFFTSYRHDGKKNNRIYNVLKILTKNAQGFHKYLSIKPNLLWFLSSHMLQWKPSPYLEFDIFIILD